MNKLIYNVSKMNGTICKVYTDVDLSEIIGKKENKITMKG